MRFSYHVALFIGALVTLLSGGCSTYTPPSTSDESAATIKIVSQRFMRFVYIREIDGEKTSSVPSLGLARGPSEIKVSAGRHTFLIEEVSGSTRWWTKLWLEVEPKATYLLNTENKGLTFKAWFLDSRSGAIVGGTLPLD